MWMRSSRDVLIFNGIPYRAPVVRAAAVWYQIAAAAGEQEEEEQEEEEQEEDDAKMTFQRCVLGEVK